MATILDAFLLTIGLDSSGYKKGRKDVESDNKALREDSEKTAKTLNENSKKVADGIGEIRDSVIGLFAAFTAGRGLKEFVSALTASDSALGRAAKNIGVSTDQLSAWQGVAERVGGTAQGITGSMQNLAQQFQQLQATGQSGVVPYFRALGVGIADSAGKMRPMRDILFDVSDRLSKLDPAKAQFFGKGLGFDEGTINVLMQGRAAIADLLAEQEKLGHANAEDAKYAQQRQSAFRGLAQASEDLGRKLLTAATPAILAVTSALTKIAEWAAKHGDFVKALFIGIAAAVTAFSIALAAPLAGIAALVTAIGAAVTAIALLYDDWKTWTKGGKSAFSDFWQFFADSWKNLETLIRPALDAIGTFFKDYITTLKDALKAGVALFFGSGEEIRAAWSKLFGDLKRVALDWVNVFKEIAPLIGNAIKSAFSAAFDWVESRAKAVWEAITGKKWTGTGTSTPKTNRHVSEWDIGQGPSPQSSDIDKLIAMGWTRAQAAGIAVNLQRESGGNIGAIGDHGQAYGLGQWHPDRQAAFKDWAGKDIRQSTRDEQLAFVNYELTEGSEKSAGTRLRGASSARDAGDIVSRYYERPADEAGEARLRGARAAALYGVGAPDAALTNGASVASSVNSTITNNAASSNSNSVTINGGIQVQTQAKDAEGIAQTIGAQVNRYASLTAQANYSLAN